MITLLLLTILALFALVGIVLLVAIGGVTGFAIILDIIIAVFVIGFLVKILIAH